MTGVDGELALPEPTDEQCDSHATITVGGRRAVATWHYPKMGGYVAKSWVVPDPDDDGCFDVYLWHDGQFPFGGDDESGYRDPVVLHHCDADGFARFAAFAAKVCRSDDPRERTRAAGADAMKTTPGES